MNELPLRSHIPLLWEFFCLYSTFQVLYSSFSVMQLTNCMFTSLSRVCTTGILGVHADSTYYVRNLLNTSIGATLHTPDRQTSKTYVQPVVKAGRTPNLVDSLPTFLFLNINIFYMKEPTFFPRYKGLFFNPPCKGVGEGLMYIDSSNRNTSFAHCRLSDLLAFWSLTISWCLLTVIFLLEKPSLNW